MSSKLEIKLVIDRIFNIVCNNCAQCNAHIYEQT